jgi:hypothetical protein
MELSAADHNMHLSVPEWRTSTDGGSSWNVACCKNPDARLCGFPPFGLNSARRMGPFSWGFMLSQVEVVAHSSKLITDAG